MNIYSFYQEAVNFRDTYIRYKHFHGINRKQEMRLELLKDIVKKTNIKFASNKNVSQEPISRIKLNGNYSRKLIVQVFSAFDLKVIRYTREYGRTIVHLEDTSHSPK